MSELTHDGFLGGRLHLWQPRAGYRAGVDPVLLAATVPEDAQTVLDLGCGVGAASLCLARRMPNVRVTGIEQNPVYADLARRNAAEADLPLEVITADLARMPGDLRQKQFDHVIANPPYFLRSASTPAPDAGREAAMGEATPLADWVQAAARRARPKGQVTFIQRAERLPELIALFQQHLGSVQVLPLIPRAGRTAQLVLIRGKKGGRAAFCLHDGLRMHAGVQHGADGDGYTAQIAAVLRDGAALPFS